MKGAELALVVGTRIKVGAAEVCDVVIADATLGDLAFELDVAEDGVTLVRPDGATVRLEPFQVHDFGTTAVAVGPAEGPWQPLVRAAEAAASATAEPAEPAEPTSEEVPAENPDEDDREKKPSKRRRVFGCLAVVLLAILIVLLLAALWFGRDVWDWWKVLGREDAPASVVCDKPQLAEIAAENGLQLVRDEDGVPLLRGNVRRRTERLAVRALALAAESRCRFDLTDDETLLGAADALLFAYTDGAIKAVAASNRVVTLSGWAPDRAAFERAVRALDADVKGIERVDSGGVSVGTAAPERPKQSAFVPKPREELRPAAAKKSGAKPARSYPIAGILTRPYPCVVMRDGRRLMEGAQIGGTVLERIEADRLVLREGKTTFDWRP